MHIFHLASTAVVYGCFTEARVIALDEAMAGWNGVVVHEMGWLGRRVDVSWGNATVSCGDSLDTERDCVREDQSQHARTEEGPRNLLTLTGHATALRLVLSHTAALRVWQRMPPQRRGSPADA